MEKTKVIYCGKRYDMIDCVNSSQGILGLIVDENGNIIAKPISMLKVMVRKPITKTE